MTAATLNGMYYSDHQDGIFSNIGAIAGPQNFGAGKGPGLTVGKFCRTYWKDVFPASDYGHHATPLI